MLACGSATRRVLIATTQDHQSDCRHVQFAIRAPTFRYAVRKSPRNYTVRVLVHASRLTPHVNWLAWRLKYWAKVIAKVVVPYLFQAEIAMMNLFLVASIAFALDIAE